jgi:hypothetical protein
MNETKVNTKNPAASRAGAKKVVADATEYVGSFETVYGRTYINRGASTDHLAMRARQLSSLLLMIHGAGLDQFQRLGDKSQDSILWLAHQLSSEIEDTIDIQVTDLLGDRA